jgi:uncharacterized protein YcfL
MKKFLLNLSITAALLTGCATEPLPPPAPNSIPAKVEQLGEMSYLVVSNITATKRNRLMAIQAEILNTDSNNQQLYYRFKWLDKNGMVIGDDEAWQPLLVYAGQTQTINALAPSMLATDFRILVSSPDNKGL